MDVSFFSALVVLTGFLYDLSICGQTFEVYRSFSAENYALPDHKYKVVTSVPFAKCKRFCRSERACISVNFQGNLESKGCCTLNGCGVCSAGNNSLLFSPGCTYHQLRATEAAIVEGGKYSKQNSPDIIYSITAPNCTVTNAVALGLASGAIPNDRITASSYYGASWEPWRGRLNNTGGGGCWGPKKNRLGEYLQVDLGQVKEIVQFATQGRYNANRWTKAFELGYRVNGSEWTRYEVNGQVKGFPGNWDRNSIKTNLVSPSFKAQYVRFYPTKYYHWMDFRAELFGCDT